MRFAYRENVSDNSNVEMGLTDVDDENTVLTEDDDDDVFVNYSDVVETSSVGSAAASTSTSSDDDVEEDQRPWTVLRCDTGALVVQTSFSAICQICL